MSRNFKFSKRICVTCKFTKKLFSICLIMSLFFAINIFEQQNHLSIAENQSIAQEVFITKSELIQLHEETNAGEGFLSSGGNTDKQIRIKFGNRANGVEYYDSSYGGGAIKITKPGPIIWLVAGYHKPSVDNPECILLVSEEPLLSSNEAGSSSYSFFNQFTGTNTFFNFENVPELVLSNHWGASSLRKTAQELYESMFSTSERSIMTTRIVSTLNEAPSNINSISDFDNTYDILFAPGVGRQEDNSVDPNNNFVYSLIDRDVCLDRVHRSHLKGLFWLRSSDYPSGGDNVWCMDAFKGLESRIVTDPAPAGTFAFLADFSSVLFVSSVAHDTCSEGTFCEIPSGDMALRLDGTLNDGPFKDLSPITFDGKDTITYSAPENSRLMIIATDSSGKTYQYAQNIHTDTSNATLNLNSIPGLPIDKFKTKIWIETNAEGELLYATPPIDAAPQFPEIRTKIVKTSKYGNLNFMIRDIYSVLPSDFIFDIKNPVTGEFAGDDNIVFKERDIPFDLIVYQLDENSNQNIISGQLNDPLEVWVQLPKDFNKDQLLIARIAEDLRDQVYNYRIQDTDGITYCVFRTDHLSPFTLTDPFSPAEIYQQILAIVGLLLVIILAIIIVVKVKKSKKKSNKI